MFCVVYVYFTSLHLKGWFGHTCRTASCPKSKKDLLHVSVINEINYSFLTVINVNNIIPAIKYTGEDLDISIIIVVAGVVVVCASELVVVVMQ